MSEGDDGELGRARRRAVLRALAEDLGDVGDLTSAACVPIGSVGRAEVVTRATGVVAGLDLLTETYRHVDEQVEVALRRADGDEVEPGAALAEIVGPLAAILTGERTALNLVSHLSGIATATSVHVAALDGTGCTIRDTRKTTPGLRLLEKAAVVAGGGDNHRAGLSDELLVKDNHVAAAGGVAAATRAALAAADGRTVQVEVTSLEDARDAIAAGATDLLLDNLTPDEVRRFVAAFGDDVRLEASGGITTRTVRAYAATGVDALAVGAITHSAPALDVALDVVEVR